MDVNKPTVKKWIETKIIDWSGVAMQLEAIYFS
jgi:hypothetical protein